MYDVYVFTQMHETEDSPKKSTAGVVEHCQNGVAISNSVHDLSPTLWHALDVWRCVRYGDSALTKALHSLSNCALKLATESWYVITVAVFDFGPSSLIFLYYTQREQCIQY